MEHIAEKDTPCFARGVDPEGNPWCGLPVDHDGPHSDMLPAESDAHAPVKVSHFAEFPGWVFIACACGQNPISNAWLREHWAGDPEAGKAAVHALIAAQAETEARVTPPAAGRTADPSP